MPKLQAYQKGTKFKDMTVAEQKLLKAAHMNGNEILSCGPKSKTWLVSVAPEWLPNFAYWTDFEEPTQSVFTQEQAEESETILQEAQRLIHGDRRDDYGHPFHDFDRVAKIWSLILGVDVTAEQVPLCMVAIKLSRQINHPKRDNIVDMAGYLGTLEMVEEYRRGKPSPCANN